MNRMPAVVEMNVAEGPEAEGALRATVASGPSATLRAPTPDPEVSAKVQRRTFTAEYRLRILSHVDACKKPGEVGALLRREGLYSSLVTASPTRGGRATGSPRPTPRAEAAGGRSAREAARGGESQTPAQARASGDDHHPPKKSCRDPGDPPEAPRH